MSQLKKREKQNLHENQDLKKQVAEIKAVAEEIKSDNEKLHREETELRRANQQLETLCKNQTGSNRIDLQLISNFFQNN
jgi:hypothetical protein